MVEQDKEVMDLQFLEEQEIHHQLVLHKEIQEDQEERIVRHHQVQEEQVEEVEQEQ